MSFNIKDHIDRLKQQRQYQDPITHTVTTILNKFIPGISRGNFEYHSGIIFLKKISPQKKMFIKLNKQKIIVRLKKEDIIVRDII
ncbi:MAG: hypothetical protein MRY57_03885 [Candidatus Pacebacteria bacterium]|nr:hypothetical protein [Candidatus Paceibacterota bacterium]